MVDKANKHVCRRKFTDRDLEDVMDAWELDLRYFPKDHDFQAVVMDKLRKLCCCHESLVWISGAVSASGEWQAFGAVRDLYCRRYKPADGIEPEPYSPDNYDAEMRGKLLDGKEYFKKLAEWKREQKLLPGEVPPTEPAQEKPKPPFKLGDIRRALFDPGRDDLRKSTLKEDEEQLEKDKLAAEPTRTPEDRARLIADIEAQLQRKQKEREDTNQS